MINILIAYDSEDKKLGEYFTLCKEDLEKNARSDSLLSLKIFDSSFLNQVELELYMKDIDKCIFVPYMHGTDNAVGSQEEGRENFVEVNTSTHLFKNKIFYTNACYSGIELGPDLIKNGALVFIGFTEGVAVINGYEDIFLECDNYAILQFLKNKDKTFGQCFEEMIAHYTKTIDNIIEGNESVIELDDLSFLAADLVDIRESLIFLGDKNLTFNTYLKE